MCAEPGVRGSLLARNQYLCLSQGLKTLLGRMCGGVAAEQEQERIGGGGITAGCEPRAIGSAVWEHVHDSAVSWDLHQEDRKSVV